MNTVLKAQAFSLHRNYTIIYRFTKAVNTYYNLQNLLYRNLKILNIKKVQLQKRVQIWQPVSFVWVSVRERTWYSM
uniref:Uncharacterized protein n=1 Tax=Anguilla anguilla TaxID=7936 RepID=A0A0E9WRC3_ANGAN